MDYQDLLLIGGAPRSGTTLVQNMLDSQPPVYGGPEFGHLPDLVQLRRKMHASARAGRLGRYGDESAIDAGFRELILRWLAPAARARGATRIAEKTPGNSICLGELLELFPQACGVHVVRDPRAVLASLYRVRERYWESGRTLPERLASPQAMCRLIAAHFLGGLEAVQARPERTALVRYEELVCTPEPAVRSLCRKVKLEYRAEMLQPACVTHDAEALVRVGTPWYTLEEFRRNPSRDRLDAWRAELSPRDLEALAGAFGPALAEVAHLGYPLAAVEHRSCAVDAVR